MDFSILIHKATPWLLTSGLRIIGILIVAFIARRFGHVIIERLIRKAIVGDGLSPAAEKKREDTLIRVFSTTFLLFVVMVSLLMIASELGADTGPLIAGAGILGIAAGFGGQYLVRDIVTGFFILLENQYRVGDVVCFDGTCGLVEDISLRMTTLRDLDGTVHHVPNGEIKKTSNLSKLYSRVNINVGVGYDSDLEKVIKVINKVGNELAKDKEWKDKIKSPPQFLRVNDFGDSAIEIKILGDTEPLEQWSVAGELRKRIKIAFDHEGIDIPFPQRVIRQAKSQA